MIASLDSHAPSVHPTAWVAHSALVAGRVRLGEQVNIWYGCVLRGDVGAIEVGPRSNVQDMSVLHISREGPPCILGADVLVGHRAVLHGCTVEDRAFIGIGAIVLDGARIGAGAMIAAGSLVPPGMVVPPESLVMGSPAKVRRRLSPDELAKNLGQVQSYLRTTEMHRHLVRQPQGQRRP